MYMGKVVEYADVRTILKTPKHPYTQGLLHSIPRIGRKDRLEPIKGSVPDPTEVPVGCAFAPRCPHAVDRCREEQLLSDVGPDHSVSCWQVADSRRGGESGND
jgi:oligopeptide/dipeptide ABC transporter ATP-binding protein